jgi:hypothetical protein
MRNWSSWLRAKRLGLHPVDERQVGGVVVEALTLQDVVQHHQAPQVGQRLVAQERGQPHQRLGVAAAVLRQAGQIVGGAEVRVVKRKVQHHRPGARAAAQPVVGHLAHVLVQQLHLAPGAAPVELVGGEQAAGVRNAQAPSNSASRIRLRRLPALSLASAARRMGSMSTPVTWIEITGFWSSVILISPISLAQSRHLRSTSCASRPGMGERKVPWFSAARRCAGQALQRLHLGHQRAEQQRLQQPRVVAQVLGRGRRRPGRA